MYIGWISTPGASSGTMNIVRPSCLGTSKSERVSMNTCDDSCAVDVNIFCPSITHSSPSRTDLHLAAAASDPESGSVYPSAIRTSPSIIPRTKRCFWSSVPTRSSVWHTSRVEPQPSRWKPRRAISW